MNTQELIKIKEKINVAKETKAKAEGAIERIKDQWEKEYGFTELKDAENKLTELDNDLAKIEKKIDILFYELTSLIGAC